MRHWRRVEQCGELLKLPTVQPKENLVHNDDASTFARRLEHEVLRTLPQ
jgi:hypothetical protein